VVEKRPTDSAIVVIGTRPLWAEMEVAVVCKNRRVFVLHGLVRSFQRPPPEASHRFGRRQSRPHHHCCRLPRLAVRRPAWNAALPGQSTAQQQRLPQPRAPTRVCRARSAP